MKPPALGLAFFNAILENLLARSQVVQGKVIVLTLHNKPLEEHRYAPRTTRLQDGQA